MKTLAIFVAAAALAASARGEIVTAEPDALLDYIEATGSQYINTGVNAETGLKAIIDFAWADEDLSGVDWSLLDACTASSSNDNRSRFFMCHMTNGKPYFGYGKTRKNPAGAVPFVRGERCEIITDMSSTNSLELTQNGVNTFDETDRETFATNENENVNLNLNLFVFATNYDGAPNWYGKGKLYELKIFKKNATTDEFDLLRHYIPCIKGNRAGLYDKVNGTISFSFGSTNFIAGPVKITNTTGDLTLTAGGDYIVNGHVTITGDLIIQGCAVGIDFGEPSGILSSCLTVGGTVRVENGGEAGSLHFGGARVVVYSDFTASPKVVESIIDNDTPYTAGEVDALSGKTFTAIPSGYRLVKFSDGNIRIRRPGDAGSFKTKDNADFKMGSDYCFVTDGDTKVELKLVGNLFVGVFDKMGDARFTVKDGDGTAVSVTYGYEADPTQFAYLSGNHFEASFTMPASSDVTVSARVCVPVTYIDGNGAAQVCRDYTLLPTDGDDLFYYKEQKHGSGWYVSMGVTVNEAGFCLPFKEDSDVHLILCDGTTTTVNVNGDHALICGGLTIYGQSGGTGTLTLNTNHIAIEAYTLTICGGSVSATSSNSEAINVNGDIIVKGGTLTACTDNGTGSISCSGTLRLSGGTVAATKGAIYTYYGTTIATGLAYTDGSHYYMGNIGSDDLYNLGAVTLTPLPAVTLNETDGVTTLVSHAGEAVGVMFKRSFTSGVASTVCLPFDFTPTGGTYYVFHSVDKSTSPWTVTMKAADPDNRAETDANGHLLANTPYLFMPSADGEVIFSGVIANVASSYTAGSVTKAATNADGTTDTGHEWQFNGTYVLRTWYDADPGNIYAFSANQITATDGVSTIEAGEFFRISGGDKSRLRPFRACMEYVTKSSSSRGMRRTSADNETLPEKMTVRLIGLEGIPTQIGTLDTRTGDVTFDGEAWYSLDGRRLTGRPSAKGVYIHNGRKTVMK